MAQDIYPTYPPNLLPEQERYLLNNIKDWSVAHGLAVRPTAKIVAAASDDGGVLATTAPVTLFPSLFPRSCFNEAIAIQKQYNKLYAAITCDLKWLGKIVEELLDIDDFVARLWEIHKNIEDEGYVQDLSLGLFRSDYMVNVESKENDKELSIKQVEFNTIASSFGGLSSQVSELHSYLSAVDAYPENVSHHINKKNLVLSDSIKLLANGLAFAHQAYSQDIDKAHLCVLFIVQEPERNVFDQRLVEYELHRKGVRSFRLPLKDVLRYTTLDAGRRLIYRPPYASNQAFQASTVYLRAGYSPAEYIDENFWKARAHLERSKAIKCPSIITHLAGCKKVQQVLATPNSTHLERFIKNDEDRRRIAKTFAPIFPLDESKAGLEAREIATSPESSKHYVLKPQREGGGNNVYRETIPEFLEDLPKSHWPAWILMKMIEPPVQKNSILRDGQMQSGGVICELGVYGVCLWRQNSGRKIEDNILENEEAGYLLRTKGDSSNEGGVAAGFGAVDSCCLIDI